MNYIETFLEYVETLPEEDTRYIFTDAAQAFIETCDDSNSVQTDLVRAITCVHLIQPGIAAGEDVSHFENSLLNNHFPSRLFKNLTNVSLDTSEVFCRGMKGIEEVFGAEIAFDTYTVLKTAYNDPPEIEYSLSDTVVKSLKALLLPPTVETVKNLTEYLNDKLSKHSTFLDQPVPFRYEDTILMLSKYSDTNAYKRYRSSVYYILPEHHLM